MLLAGSGLPPATDSESSLEVVVADLEGSPDGAHVEVRNASGGESVTADLSTESDGRFTEIEVTPASDANFTFNVTEPADAPVDEPELEAATGHHPIGFAVIEHGDVDISSATYTFTVSRDRLDELGADPESVTLFRHENGEWVAKSTTLENASGDRLTYAGTSDGFSTYAIGAKPATETDTATDAPGDTATATPERADADTATGESAETRIGDDDTQTRASEERTTVQTVGTETPVLPIAVVGGALVAPLLLVLVRRS